PAGEATMGTKTELKNMNSFNFLRRGMEAEIARQEAIVRAGGEVEQETLHYDVTTGALTPLRSKEYAHDYRYFPEPDLVPLAPTEEMIARARDALPELPAARAGRFEDLGLPADDARLLAFRAELGDYFEAALAAGDGLTAIVERVLERNAEAVEKVRAGNEKAIGAIIGAVMRETKGRADGGEVQRMIRERI